MGRKKSIVCGITTLNTNVSFHRFNKSLWCDILDLNAEMIPNHSFICSNHFRREDILCVGGKRILTGEALPLKPIEKTSNRLLFFGDITKEDLDNPQRRKICWSIAKRTVARKNQKIKALQNRNRWLKNQVCFLKTFTQHLRQKNLISENAQFSLNKKTGVCTEMETILEQQRRYHEERERLVDAMVKEMLHKKNTYRETINSEQRLKYLLDRYINSTDKLIELYEDKDGQRKSEVASLTGPNEFNEFYSRLKQIKDFYRKHPNEISVPMSVEFDEFAKARENPNEDMANFVEFTDEEGYGKYLDLHECYEKFINLKGIEKVDYITYIGLFDQLYDIPKERKTGEYRKYLSSLIEYLMWFVQRIRPLMDLEKDLQEVVDQVLANWDSGTVPGWPKETGSALTNVGAHLDLSAFSSWEELASLGLDRLKSALMALGLKCGGTLEERAQRLFSTKGKGSLDPSLMKKANKGKASKDKEQLRHRELATLEAQVYRLADLVAAQRAATKENIQRKQARTDGERDDSENDESDEESPDEGEDDVPYNPKNLPLGWDGKPIPYWLYKLHGLNISYNCEICGNYVYKGPKAFQRHFAEWRHAHGMRCLGIPNTAHFANVTQIEDALALWEKLKVQKQSERWQPETEEEYEDSQGNVVNRKTYEDLKRQGLL